MTLVSEIIRDAFREGNLIAINADPTADEQAEGLRLLNRFISSLYGTKRGEKFGEILIGRNNISRPQGFPWYDQVPPSSEWFVPINQRLILNLTTAQTVYLDPMPNDGSRFAILDESGNLSSYNLTIDANGRLIDGATTAVVITDSANYEYVYRADTGTWSRVSPLEAADTFPFPEEFEDLFVIGLASRINPRNGVTMDEQTVGTYNSQMKAFKARYRQKVEISSEAGLLRLPSNRRNYYDDGRAGAEFTSGYPR